MIIGKLWITKRMIDQIAAETGKNRTTVARWIRRGRLPKTEYRLLKLLHHGDLGDINDAWLGWVLCSKTNMLYPPNGTKPFKPGHLFALELRFQLLAELQHQNTKLKRNLSEKNQTINTLRGRLRLDRLQAATPIKPTQLPQKTRY